MRRPSLTKHAILGIETIMPQIMVLEVSFDEPDAPFPVEVQRNHKAAVAYLYNLVTWYYEKSK